MFGRLIVKISSFNRTPILRWFTQINNTDEIQTVFPCSVKNFEDLVSPENIFIDKSLLIEKLLKYSSSALSITRPRGWGRSLSIEMLDTFFLMNTNLCIIMRLAI
ncbi:hypothetical protein SteCoe_36664 [Stentor coeruleus]|uniref:AAA-ATPase-like domain-containing protein n=1 Tax=Stentor coeruleus TaxID=5963 RepID=A0A1R2APL3_9CILI|nr:hypothetical protein SteCoe_36664 [Stentor coeruleus]